ncbi:MAG TPA: CDP-alcohol phosphatidyltransferase family protein [Ktedonobacterales bacterium]
MPDPSSTGAPTAPPADASPDASGEGASFVAGLLRDLRAGGYRPRAWWRFFTRSWQRSRATAHAHPRLVRDWAVTSAAMWGGALAVLAVERRAADHAARARRAAPWVALGLAAHTADVYAHLGMNAATRGGVIYDTLGVGTKLTMIRQAVATLLWGHFWSGAKPSRPALAAALAVAGASDLADGAIARLTRHTTHLGAYLDGMADLSVSLALALTLRRQRLIAHWFLVALAGRWLLPLGGALYHYFVRARPVPLRALAWGKAAGAAQHAALALALAPDGGSRGIAHARRVGQALAAACLVMAPLAHLRAVRHRGD